MTDIIMCPLSYGADKAGLEHGPTQLMGRYPELASRIRFISVARKPENFSSANLKFVNTIASTCTIVAETISYSIGEGHIPILLGGDHALAMGSIKGALDHYDDIGVLWVDAHADMNTHETTHSGNIHGMPLAAVMGYGHPKLTGLHNDLKVDPSKVVLFGSRDVEEGEADLISAAGVHEFPYDYVESKGFDSALDEAIEYLAARVRHLHLSLDLDSINPDYIMGVSTPVAGGFKVASMIELIKKVLSRFEVTSVDIVEYNPLHDRGEVTLDTMVMLVSVIEGMLQDKYGAR